MNQELIQLNKQILMEGIFASKFLEDQELETKTIELESIGKKKKQYFKRKIKDTNTYKETWTQLDSEQKLNMNEGENNLEKYTTYKVIYDKKYDLLKDHLSILEKTYDGEHFYYLISKI